MRHPRSRSHLFCSSLRRSLGNSSRNPLHGPGSSNWDIAIMKCFRLSVAAGLQIRADFLNACNRAQFENPSGNVTNLNSGRVFSSRRGK